MKRISGFIRTQDILKRFFFIAVMAIFAFSCDIIAPEPDDPADQSDTIANATVRKVLLEKFTGHQCQFCPGGAETALRLEEFFGEKLIVVSIHAGFFSNAPASPPFNTDYRTDSGTAIHNHFGVSEYPSGMVNRAARSGSLLLGHYAWGDAAGLQLADSLPLFQVSIEREYIPSERKLKTKTTVKAMAGAVNIYKLTLYLLEDSVVSPQRTNNPAYPNGFIEDYVHRHVFRDAINGTWGEGINSGPLAKDQSVVVESSAVLHESWNADHCYIVAFVSEESGQEILQTERERLRE